MKNSIATPLLVLFLALGCSSGDEPQQSTERDAATTTERPEQEAALVAAAAFSNPSLVCEALASEGLPSLPRTRWKNTDGTGYACISDSLQITPGGYQSVGDVPNTITYYAQSDTEDRVQMVRLTANIFNEQREQPVVEKFKQLTRSLFSHLALSIPSHLLTAIDQGAPERFEEAYGVVKLDREKYKQGHGLQLTIEEASYLESVAELKESSSAQFQQCRAAIAGLRGYPISEVKGDGEPIKGQTGLSFSLEGRGGDQFFCKVRPDGQYSITAAIGGKYPFKEIGPETKAR